MRTLVVGLLIVVLVAALDEYNQSFSLSRTGSYVDVLLDISGGFTMLAILWMWNLLRSTTATGRTAN